MTLLARTMTKACNRNRRRSEEYVFFCLLISILTLSGCTFVLEEPALDRQAEVAAKGTEFMPFDLEKTTHIFEVIDDGGRQQVIAGDRR